jgi:hypothetical protein
MEEKKKEPKSLLEHGSWLMLNMPLIRKIGIDGAVLLANLVSKQKYFKRKKSLTNEGFFYNEKNSIEKYTTLSFYRQQQALKILIDEGLVETKKHGTPQRVFYRVDIAFGNEYILNLCELESEKDDEDDE